MAQKAIAIVEKLESKNDEMLTQLKDYMACGVTADCTCEAFCEKGHCPYCQLVRLIEKMEAK